VPEKAEKTTKNCCDGIKKCAFLSFTRTFLFAVSLDPLFPSCTVILTIVTSKTVPVAKAFQTSAMGIAKDKQ